MDVLFFMTDIECGRVGSLGRKDLAVVRRYELRQKLDVLRVQHQVLVAAHRTRVARRNLSRPLATPKIRVEISSWNSTSFTGYNQTG